MPDSSQTSPSTRPACFITLEGGEGAGKSTQARLLADTLHGLGIECIVTREPGGTPHAEAIRQVLLSGALAALGPQAEALAFCAARIDHLDNLIRPALKRGAWVICDRFSDSTRAYQGVGGHIDARIIQALERVTIGSTLPDLTIVLDIAPETGLSRAGARRGDGQQTDRFENETLEFHKALRRAFAAIAMAEPVRCAVVDATKDQDETARIIFEIVQQRLLSTKPARGEKLESEPRKPPMRIKMQKPSKQARGVGKRP